MADNELIVAAAALLVSVVALTATFMQVLQQYYASARGYSQCNDKVMGEWAKSKSRKFSWEELRYEVQFDAPVIFVAPPTNDRGPVPDADIFYLKGTKKSLEETGTTSEVDLRKAYAMRSLKERIHTADNERASWLVLLLAVQKMEGMSREWQEKQYRDLGPPGRTFGAYSLPSEPPTLDEAHTFTVALQRKRKSWDTMPTSVTKPYGTTTMCHMVEMMAGLGVYWKEFDRKRDRYRAEGNGFVVLGERMSELGLIFSFQVYGKCLFEWNRVIPVDDVKELCFGYVPTIYRTMLDHSRLESPSSELHTLGTLQMSSREEMGRTLGLLGCSNNAVKFYTGEESRTYHLFPVSFEILGMLSRNFHIPHSSFTYIPNPTSDRWDKRSFSLVKLMESFRVLSEYEPPNTNRNWTIYSRITNHIAQILHFQDDGKTPNRLLLHEALEAALEDCEEILTAKRKSQEKSCALLESRQLLIDTQTQNKQNRRREIVLDVLRSHIQEVLRLLNRPDERPSDTLSLLAPDMGPVSPRASRYRERTSPRFEDVDACGPDEKQHRLMEVYCEVIRTHVVANATHSTERRASDAGPETFAFRRRGSVATHSSVAVESDIGADEPAITIRASGIDSGRLSISNQPVNGGVAHTTVSSSKSHGRDVDNSIPLSDEPVSHDDVWCTLMFKMMCWLMLHDFNPEDIQLSKSELLGSRMPVYIA